MLAGYAALDHEDYLAPAVFAAERERVFGRSWLYAGLAGDFPALSQPVEIAGCTVTIAREGDRWRAACAGRPVAIATCGALVFVALAATVPPLAVFLAPFFETLAEISRHLSATDRRLRRVVAANWKILAENALDDYHTAAVHPQTLYPSMLQAGERRVGLERAGGHSLWRNALSDADAAFWDGIGRRLGLAPDAGVPEYRHLFVFPNFYLASFRGVATILHRLDPLAPEATALEMAFCMPRAEAAGAARDALKRAVLADFAAKAETVLAEDVAVCEAAQRGRHFACHPSLLGRREQRILDFQTALREAMAP